MLHHRAGPILSFFKVCFLARKIGPELTSVANLSLFCVWDATTAWLDEQCVGLCLRSEPAKSRLLKQSV